MAATAAAALVLGAVAVYVAANRRRQRPDAPAT
jgi:hypothetical protein